MQHWKTIILQLKNKIKWLTNKYLLYSTGNSAQCYVQSKWEKNFLKNRYMFSKNKKPTLFGFLQLQTKKRKLIEIRVIPSEKWS